MDLPFEIAPGVELALDVSPASWIAERLLPIDRSTGVRVGEVVPTGFEAYARIFHPARDRSSMDPVRWSELAERYGRAVHPEMQLEHIVGDPEIDRVADLISPEEGLLPRPEVEALIEALHPFTGAEDGWFAIWDGFGSLGAGIGVMWSQDGDPKATRAREQVEREWRRRAATQLEAIPRFKIHESPGDGALRGYIVLHGPISAAARLDFNGSYQSPNLWWPDDRAWCVATEVDGYSTYVGGSAACIDAILRDDRLEALPSDPNNRFDLWSDRVNPPPPGMRERWGG